MQLDCALIFLQSLDNFQLMGCLTGCRIEGQARIQGDHHSLSRPFCSAMCAIAAFAPTSLAMNGGEQEIFEAGSYMLD